MHGVWPGYLTKHPRYVAAQNPSAVRFFRRGVMSREAAAAFLAGRMREPATGSGTSSQSCRSNRRVFKRRPRKPDDHPRRPKDRPHSGHVRRMPLRGHRARSDCDIIHDPRSHGCRGRRCAGRTTAARHIAIAALAARTGGVTARLGPKRSAKIAVLLMRSGRMRQKWQ